MIYDRPVTVLMRDAAAQLTPPFSAGDVVAWFAKYYPKIKPNTVRAHVIAMTANNPNRHNYRSLRQRLHSSSARRKDLWSVSIRMSTSARRHPWIRTAT